jgi:hypothetical protein
LVADGGDVLASGCRMLLGPATAKREAAMLGGGGGTALAPAVDSTGGSSSANGSAPDLPAVDC